MNILKPKIDGPGTNTKESLERSNQRVGTLMIFIYSFFAILFTALGAFSNGCRLEEEPPATHIEE